MKKFSRIFALLLTLAVMFSVFACTASAAGNELTVSIDLTKEIEFEADYCLPNETFTFVLAPAAAEAENGVKAGVELQNNTTTISIDNDTVVPATGVYQETSTINATGTFDLPGIYHYTLSEVAGTTAHINYSKAEFDVYVYVSYKEGSSDLEIVSVQPYLSKDNDGEEVTNKTKMNPLFINEVAFTDLFASKTVTGNLGDRTKQFTFTLSTEVNELYTENAYFYYDITRTDGTMEEMVLVNVGDTVSFTLAHNEDICVYGLPVGIDLTIEEADYSALDNGNGGYTTTINGEAGRSYTTTTTTDSVDLRFVNDKNVTTTGVFMSYGPYFAIMAVALGAAVLFFATKKRSASKA